MSVSGGFSAWYGKEIWFRLRNPESGGKDLSVGLGLYSSTSIDLGPV